jgi:hypothetical protein
MKISAKDATALDHVAQSMKSSGWKAELTSVTATPNGADGRIQMRGK